MPIFGHAMYDHLKWDRMRYEIASHLSYQPNAICTGSLPSFWPHRLRSFTRYCFHETGDFGAPLAFNHVFLAVYPYICWSRVGSLLVSYPILPVHFSSRFQCSVVLSPYNCWWHHHESCFHIFHVPYDLCHQFINFYHYSNFSYFQWVKTDSCIISAPLLGFTRNNTSISSHLIFHMSCVQDPFSLSITLVGL